MCDFCASGKSQLLLIALSTIESEYIVAIEAMKEVLWVWGLLNELDVLSDNMILYLDSQCAIHLCKNPVFHEHNKYIDVRLHLITNVMSQDLIKLEKEHSDYNLVDIGTKVLHLIIFRSCLTFLNICKGM